MEIIVYTLLAIGFGSLLSSFYLAFIGDMGCRWAECPSFVCSIVGIPATIGGIVLGAATWL